MQQQEEDWVSLLRDIRLKEKDGMQSTFSSVKVEVNLTVPIWVTLAISQLGSLTELQTMEVIEVNGQCD